MWTDRHRQPMMVVRRSDMSKNTLLILSGLLLGGCARQPAPMAPQAQIQKDLPVICKLVSRHETVTISAGRRGTVYSVSDAAGKTMASYESREELRARYPLLSHQLETGIADKYGEVGLAGRE